MSKYKIINDKGHFVTIKGPSGFKYSRPRLLNKAFFSKDLDTYTLDEAKNIFKDFNQNLLICTVDETGYLNPNTLRIEECE